MADTQHIEWLSKGVSFWNKKRKDEDFTPDFSEANIPRILHTETSLKEINLEGAIFNSADLSGLDLEGANLKNVQFRRAVLKETNFTRATLASADFSGANLQKAVFFMADLNDAKLYPADFFDQGSRVDINEADLFTANLINVDITLAHPWKSKLYPPVKRIEPPSDFQKRIESIEDLIDVCQFFKTYYEGELKDYDWQFYYRGQENSSWNLKPSVMRISSDRKTNREKEGEMLLDLMSRRPEDFVGVTSALSQWVLAQHHGLKTRLLDVTRNPLVALFHACENSPDSEDSNNQDGSLHIFAVPKHLIKTFDSDAISVVSNLAKLPREEQDLLMGKAPVDIQKFIQKRSPQELLTYYNYIRGRLYSYIRQEKPYFKEKINIRDFFCVFVVEPQQSFERIRVQSGAFLISAFHERFEEEKILALNKDIPLYYHHKINVPANEKKHILEKLQVLNMNREVLFPSLEKASDAIVKQYETEVSGATAFFHLEESGEGK